MSKEEDYDKLFSEITKAKLSQELRTLGERTAFINSLTRRKCSI